MITVSAGELCGLLGDVIPFGIADEDSVSCAVRVEWDGEMLHTFATDNVHVGWSQWHPKDPPPVDVQDMLDTTWGGDDDPWAMTLNLLDAQELAKIFKLPVKERYASPLSVEHEAVPGRDVRGDETTEHRLRVRRDAVGSRSALSGVWKGLDPGLPDPRPIFTRWDRVKPIWSINFNASLLADFAQVRPRGPVQFTFTGEDKPALVEIGKRFVGAIMPMKKQEDSPGQ